MTTLISRNIDPVNMQDHIDRVSTLSAADLIATVANGDEDEISRLACSAELAHRCGPVTNIAACTF